MKNLVLVLVAMVTVCACAAAEDKVVEADTQKFVKPKFCGDIDCPPFKVIEKTEDYELREYAASSWVQTKVTRSSMMMTYRMFMSLFKYISGNNDHNKKIAMTAPVIMRMIPDGRGGVEDNYTMAFYLAPSADRSSPPAPSDASVSIINLPTMRVYVAQFGGFTNQYRNMSWMRHLKAKLKDAGRSYNDSHFYTAGYNPPFQLFNRHNEIWVLA